MAESGVEGSAGYPLGIDEIEQGGWEAFHDAATRLHDIINEVLIRRHGLALLDVQLLEHVAKCGASSMGELADVLMLVPGRLSKQVDRLERRRLIVRSTSGIDRRIVMADITDVGDAQLRTALKTYASLVRDQFLSQLTRQQMAALGDSCRRISDGLRAVDPPAKLPRM